MKAAAFWYLRTYKQLGYVVSANALGDPTFPPTLIVDVTFQSSKFS
jgi:secreted Zn-dependent insulinase-like peptidase